MRMMCILTRAKPPPYIVTKSFCSFYRPDTEHDFFYCTKLTILYLYTTYSFIFLYYTRIRTQFHHAFITTKSTMRPLNDRPRGGSPRKPSSRSGSFESYLLTIFRIYETLHGFVSWEVFFYIVSPCHYLDLVLPMRIEFFNFYFRVLTRQRRYSLRLY